MSGARSSMRGSPTPRWSLLLPAILALGACQSVAPPRSPSSGLPSGHGSPRAAIASRLPEASLPSFGPDVPSGIASGAPSQSPIAVPTLAATPRPTAAATAKPTAKPTPRPTAPPAPLPRLSIDDVVVATVDELNVRAAPRLDGRPRGLAAMNEKMLVAAGPTLADGYPWYYVIPFDAGPAGWVAAGSRSGARWLEVQAVPCPTSPLDPQEILDLGSFGGLACFGSREIQLIGEVHCDLADLDRSFSGPSWLRDHYGCTLNLGGQTLEILDGGMTLGFPMTWDAMVTGHFDDPLATSCRWAVDPPGPDPMTVVTACRAMFVGTDIGGAN
jgi:hypothetical protein